jgi:hypothetical protein
MLWPVAALLARILGMMADAVFARLRRRPFVPFRLILISGTTYDIMYPEMMFVSKSGLTVAIYDRGQQPSPEEIPQIARRSKMCSTVL